MSTAGAVVVTCEHGGNHIPRRWAPLFRGRQALLATHRGWDIGAANVARHFARALSRPLYVATTSRLLIDLNRSSSHPKLFSDVTRGLSREEKRRIVDEHYTPHRASVERALVRARTRGGFAVQLAVHSFTPVLDGVKRNADVGFLYDPSRKRERALCDEWIRALANIDPALVVRRNYPYRGIGDGFSTALRRTFGVSEYAGIEIGINQRLIATAHGAKAIARALSASFEAIASMCG